MTLVASGYLNSFDTDSSINFMSLWAINEFQLGTEQSASAFGNRSSNEGRIYCDFSHNQTILGYHHPLVFNLKQKPILTGPDWWANLNNNPYFSSFDRWDEFFGLNHPITRYLSSPAITGEKGVIKRIIDLLTNSDLKNFKLNGLIVEGTEGYKKLKDAFILTQSLSSDGFRAYIPLSCLEQDLSYFIKRLKEI